MTGRATAARGRWRLCLALVAGMAFVLRLAMLARAGGTATAVEYDDGVHYGASALLLHGVLPYRDQVFLQPPGIAVLLLPLAVAGAAFGDPVGLGAARIATCAVGGATTWLLGRLVAREVGAAAGLVAAAIYATASASLIAESTIMLEPYLNLLTVLALDQLTRGRRDGRRVLAAGGLIGLAGAVKLWAVAPLVAILGALLAGGRRRDAARLAGAATVAGALVAGPLVLLAPAAAIRDIVTTQATRPSAGTAGLGSRLLDMSGLAAAGRLDPVAALATLATVVALGVVAVRRSWLARVAAGQLCLSVLMFSVSRPYFSHYADFLVPPVAILVGTGLSVAAAGGARRRRPRAVAVRPVLPAVLAAVLTAVLTAEVATAWSRASPAAVSPRRLRAVLPPGGCVLADQPVLTAYADALAGSRCPVWLDPRGTGLTELAGRSAAGFYPYGFRALPGWQRRWLQLAAGADAAVLTGDPGRHAEWRPEIGRYISTNFRLVAVVGAATPDRLPVQVWVRRRR